MSNLGEGVRSVVRVRHAEQVLVCVFSAPSCVKYILNIIYVPCGRLKK